MNHLRAEESTGRHALCYCPTSHSNSRTAEVDLANSSTTSESQNSVSSVRHTLLNPATYQIPSIEFPSREAIAIVRKSVVTVRIIKIFPPWIDQGRKEVQAPSRMKRVKRPIWFTILEPGRASRGPSGSLELLLRMFSKFVDGFLFDINSLDGFSLESVQNLDYIV